MKIKESDFILWQADMWGTYWDDSLNTNVSIRYNKDIFVSSCQRWIRGRNKNRKMDHQYPRPLRPIQRPRHIPNGHSPIHRHKNGHIRPINDFQLRSHGNTKR